jgi:hypothetical protein
LIREAEWIFLRSSDIMKSTGKLAIMAGCGIPDPAEEGVSMKK